MKDQLKIEDDKKYEDDLNNENNLKKLRRPHCRGHFILPKRNVDDSLP